MRSQHLKGANGHRTPPPEGPSAEAKETEQGPAPPLPQSITILDPFCGEGSVLAAANVRGVEAVGVDLSRKRCRHAAAYIYVAE